MDKDKYLNTKLKPIMENLIFQLVCERPDDPETFMLNWLRKTGGYASNGLSIKEKEELEMLRKEIANFRAPDGTSNKDNFNKEESDEEDDYYDPQTEPKKGKVKKEGRKGISAESYGKFNKKENFKPRSIQKSETQITKIKARIIQSFLFCNLEANEINIIIGAMEEKNFKAGATVIAQGDNGECLYVVESGELDCFKKFPDSTSDKYLKTYFSGEAFGELALLYNAPRAATIKAKTDTLLWCLDRDTFNNIVKESAMNRREKYEQFLKSVGILSTMDDYEISQVSEALKRFTCKADNFIIRQGEVGDVFYIIEEGEAIAFSNNEPGKAQIPELKYSKGSYFGELALIKDQPRAANVKAVTDVQLLALDRSSFKRVFGPIDKILKRNADKYNKYVSQK